MKHLLILQIACLSIFIHACSPSIIKKTVEHNYTNIVFTPESVEKLIGDNISIKLTPIDAISINRETIEAAQRDGNYEKEVAIQLDKIKSDINNIPNKIERQRQLSKVKAVEYISDLISKGNIPSIIGSQLQYRILLGSEYGRNGTEVTSLSENDIYNNNFNPYYINNRYLSVFKITFSNKGNKIRTFNIKDIQISSGEELLYPLKNKYFEDIFSGGSDLLKNIYRMNMPDELTITPEQVITKYISIPAINPRNSNLRFQIIENSIVSNFDFSIKEKESKNAYNLEEFKLFPVKVNNGANLFYYAISYPNNLSYATSSYNVFIPTDKFNDSITVYCISINDRTGEVKLGTLQHFVPKSSKKHQIEINNWNK